jgi:hypothetical protein
LRASALTANVALTASSWLPGQRFEKAVPVLVPIQAEPLPTPTVPRRSLPTEERWSIAALVALVLIGVVFYFVNRSDRSVISQPPVVVTPGPSQDGGSPPPQNAPTTQEWVHAAYILLKLEGKDEPTVWRRAEEILAKAKAGVDFAELARQYSEDGAAQRGGDVGFIERGLMIPEFEQMAFSLQPGQMSEVFKTPVGLQIVKVLDRTWSLSRPVSRSTETTGPPTSAPTARLLLAIVGDDVRQGDEFKLEGVTDDSYVTEDGIDSARAYSDGNSQPAVLVSLRPAGSEKLGKLTENNINKRLGVVIDGRVVSSGIIESKISYNLQISSISAAEVEGLVSKINAILNK